MNKLWYTQPAERFEEALPVGAGRFGAMLYGAPDCECLRLNADSVWSGGLRSRINPDAKEGYKEIRSLIQQEHIAEAESLAFQKMQGCPPDMRHYLPLGELAVRLNLPDGEVSGYRRELNLENAVYTVTFRIGKAAFRREIFASYPAKSIIMRFSADVPFGLSAQMHDRGISYDNNCIVQTADGAALLFDGGNGTKNGIQHATAIRAAGNGKVYACGNTLYAKETTEITLVCSTETSYYQPDADLQTLALQISADAVKQDYAAARDAHTTDYQTLFQRVSLELPGAAQSDSLPTDQLLQAVRSGDLTLLNALLTLYFQFGRYLMIAGSRPGSLPLNLQGIWNEALLPPWGSKYTININTEMNYWCAEVCNLSECHLPLFDLLHKVAENGSITAAEMYGLRGFCCHHNTDLWGDTAPQDLWIPATIWPMGGAWLSLHIMEHYRYTLDRDFLRAHYKILHGAARFCSDYLTENEQGQLVTCPSVSPENTYRLPNGEKGCLCAGPSMDTQIITELFRDVIKANEILEMHDALTETLQMQLTRLPQPEIGKYGQIKEWAVDYDEEEPGHRHISQLFALHPAHQISPRRTPELASAAKATLHRRLTHGGGHTGWSCAWIANMYARLQSGEQVYTMLTKLMQDSTNPNLFDMHPPFQIDGNFGGTAAIAEALMQSDADGITLMPALPAAWQSGTFTGLCAYGGFTVSAAWQEGCIRQLTVRAAHGGKCRILLPENNAPLHLQDGTIPLWKEADGFLCFEAAPNGVYRLNAE